MACKYCNKEVVLVPSAQERSKKYGMPASYYTKLFQNHAKCELENRKKLTQELLTKQKKFV